MIRRNHLGSEHLDAEYVECLTANILLPHVNDALHTETSANGSSGYSVLTSASLSDDPSLSNPSCKKYLRDNVLNYDLLRSANRRPTCPIALLILCDPVWLLWTRG